MSIVTMKELLEAGVHFGHQTRKWNPKMKSFIFSERNGIYIIDLSQTITMLEEAYNYVKKLGEDGGRLLFVGTKKQAQETIYEEATRAGAFYVNHRWLGGLLTNFETIRKSIERMEEIMELEESGQMEELPRKEAMMLRKKREKLERSLIGIRDMKTMPDAIFVVDTGDENIAVAEGKKLGIPIIAIADTNSNPDLIDHLIPANDDAIRSIKLITSVIARAYMDGKGVLTEGKEIGEELPEDVDEEVSEGTEDKVKLSEEEDKKEVIVEVKEKDTKEDKEEVKEEGDSKEEGEKIEESEENSSDEEVKE